MNLQKDIIIDLKKAILQSRYKAARYVNQELVKLYFEIGKKISVNVDINNWGTKVLEQISAELQKELPGLKGFSAGNLKKMKVFAEFWIDYLKNILVQDNKTYTKNTEIGSTLSNELQNSEIQNNTYNKEFNDEFAKAFFATSFSHHYLIASKVKSIDEAKFYIFKTAKEFLSYRNLLYHFKNDLYSQVGNLPNNFEKTLSTENTEKALKTFKDEYLLDFINIEDPDEEDERLIENEIVRNIKKFILTLGSNFSFIGNQHRLIVEEEEFFIDLLFFNRELQCLVAIELKKGKFKPEYLGKMNFYLSALDDTLKLPHEKPSIGIILCKEKNNKIVEYSFRDFNKAMGVAKYCTTSEIPEKYKGILPSEESLKKLLN